EMVNEENIPSEGRYIFASNHPLGGLDGICLSAIVGGRFGGNIRYLVNDLLLYLPNLRSIFVPINKHGAQGKQNAELIENAYASDNQIITFPAGLCSRKIDGRIQDPEWKKSFIQKAVEYKRDIVPVYFNGRNSNFFYRLTNLRKALGIKMNYEMIYLPDEMFRCKHKTFRICFGTPIPWQTFDHSRKPTEWAEWVRQCVYKLKDK
ncbi:MAG: 1-acyl-sn-glycerol-3-phosphate acyltransferase, partial [Tannerellaceae bacterium]